MTPHQRILAVLRGERPDRVPFTCKIPQPPRGEIERQLRNEGLATIAEGELLGVDVEGLGTGSATRPNVEILRQESLDHGRLVIRETLRTPVGEVHQTWRAGGAYGTSRLFEYPVKHPEDYAVVEYIIRDEVYRPTYDDVDESRQPDKFVARTEIVGEDGFVFGGWMAPSPLMFMLWCLLGPEQFAVDIRERPELFSHLHEILFERQCEQYRLAANSPALVIHMAENMTSDMIGPQLFRRYCLPCYNEFASCLHAQGKLLAVHMDGRMKAIAEAVADSQIDIIEGFSPVPDGDLELAEARRLWPDKIIWMNFPSPVHLLAPDQIAAHTRQILRDVAPGDRFLLGITEDIPHGAWQISLPIISQILREEGNLPLSPS